MAAVFTLLIIGGLAGNASGQCDPYILGSVDTPYQARNVAISGTVAYVADAGSGLQVIDVSNPAAPVILGSVDTPDNALGVAVSGTLAYVADFGSGLQVIDVLRCNLGACCVDGGCIGLMSEANCLALGGTFFGIGSTCSTSPACPPACAADFTGPGDGPPDGIVGILDFLKVLTEWGACPP